MESLFIEATKYTPEIKIDSKSSVVDICGKSYPENTFEFYKPVLEWVENFFKNPKENLTLNMEVIYFNSSSSKLFFDLFDILDDHREKTQIVVKWIFDEENESALEAGEDFKDDFKNLNIQLIQK